MFDEKVEEVTQYIDDNDITKEEVEALLDALPEDYFMKAVLQSLSLIFLYISVIYFFQSIHQVFLISLHLYLQIF